MNFERLCNGEPLRFEPGIYPQMPRTDYNRIPALSCSVLKKWLSLEIPSEFEYWMKTRWEEPPTEALLIGSALDCRLLDGDYWERFAIAPKVDRRTNAGKAGWAAFEKLNAGKTILTQEQGELVENMDVALIQAKSLDGVFEHCEKTVICAELFGYPAKAEMDFFNSRSEHLLDLKSCRDVSPKWFTKACVDFGYFEQATVYLMIARAAAIEKSIFDFIAVKKEAPWTVKVYSFSPWGDPDHWTLFEGSRVRLERAANEIAQRLEVNNFRDSQDWELLRIPEYALRQAKLETLLVTL
jgi:hypothetical protein